MIYYQKQYVKYITEKGVGSNDKVADGSIPKLLKKITSPSGVFFLTLCL